MATELNTIDDLKAAAQQLREEAKKMQLHLKRMMEEYGDFEDRILALDKVLEEAEKEAGLVKEEIMKPPEPINLLEEFM